MIKAITDMPCFRQANLWGIGAGTIVGLAQSVRTRSGLATGNAFVLSYALFSSLKWMQCRNQFEKKKEVLEDAMNAQVSYHNRLVKERYDEIMRRRAEGNPIPDDEEEES